MSLHNEVLKNSYISDFNRVYTSFGRLATFLANTNQIHSIIEMSEVGLYNESDVITNLKHFEC